MANALFSEKKSSTKDIEKGTDELEITLLIEKKSSTKYFDKGTDELEFMKQKLNTIHRKGLDQFEGQSIRSKGWFKPDIEFLKTTFSKSQLCLATISSSGEIIRQNISSMRLH